MADDDIKKLNYKRGTIKGKLTTFQKYIDRQIALPHLTDIQLAELQLRYERIAPIFDEFDALQTEIEMLSASAGDVDVGEERTLFEDAYYACMSSAQVLIHKYSKRRNSGDHESEVSSASTVVKTHNSSFINLPKIDLPRFEGGYHNWLAFRDTYLSLIHNNESINTINKFHYLRASLKGSAALIIQSLDLTNDNYSIAWQLLSDRYDNQKLLVAHHVSALFNVEPIPRETSHALRSLLDIINKNLRALQSLGQPVDNWDTLVVYMMSHKLDSVTSREWEERRNSETSVASLETFKTFLLQRADFLESIESMKNNKFNQNHHVHQQSSSSSGQVKSKSFIATHSDHTKRRNSYSHQCPLCKKEHHLYNCSLFRRLPVETRLLKAKTFKVCLNCLCHGHVDSQCRLSYCKYCNQRHNTLIHTEPARETQSSHEVPQNIAVVAKQAVASSNASRVLLSTALVKVRDSEGQLQTARILLDNGSTSNFITMELCGRLGLRTSSVDSKVTGINSHTSNSSQACSIQIHSMDGSFKTSIDCYVLPNITTCIPSTYISIHDIQVPTGIQLADPTFNTPACIEVLVGADIFWAVLGSNRIQLGKNQPTLFETKLGWLVSGSIKQPKPDTAICMVTQETIVDTQVDISRFWELDTVAPKHNFTPEERACEEHFVNTTTRDSDGRFVVSMPLRESPEVLGDSYQRALATLLSVERRLEKNPALKKLYIEFLAEYEELGHMSKTKPNSDSISCFLPHHGVLRESSTTTKLRVVFNGSSPTTSGKSFNDIQRVGPTIQDDLLTILLRFRQHNFVVTADVEKMYRQIQIIEPQRCLQKILWRTHPSHRIQEYTLNTVTYGTSSAPYLATRCLIQLGHDSNIADVKQAIYHDFYVDDFLSGTDTLEDTISLCQNVTEVLRTAKFNLRKWHSNSSDILRAVSDGDHHSDSVSLSVDESSKTLGLHWQCLADTLAFSINVSLQDKINKRIILSTIAQVFDPLGLVSPCIVEAKIIMQLLWISKCSWDGEVPEQIQESWLHFARTLPYLNHLAIPRCIKTHDSVDVTLHTFTDASEKAYGACIYVRSVGSNGSVSVRLLASKSKIAPIKPQTTIPRLELSAGLLGAKLFAKVKSSLTLELRECVFWADSTIALGWIESSPLHLKTFVRHRVSEIQELTANREWRYVPSEQNPADLVSRGLSADQLRDCSLWWSGPAFLRSEPTRWPTNPNKESKSKLPEMVEHSLVAQDNSDINSFTKLIKNSSSFTRLKRVMAYVLRFITNCRKNDIQKGNLSLQELEASTNFLLQRAQQDSFPEELALLKSNKPLAHKSNLRSLSPFLGDDSLIRVGGRLSNSSYDYNVKHPVLLSAKHHLCKLIFQMFHTKFMHSGPQLLLATTRHKYWATGGRNLAKSIVHRCIKCCRFKGKTVQPVMGNLPKERVQLEFPFLDTGVDYAGPVMISNRKGRGSILVKSYICAFVCLATKAVHLELVTDLTKEAYIAALNRFIARRGKPRTIFSDNGTTFQGTFNELSKVLDQSLSADVTEQGIQFSFIPAYSPHFGGIWESVVKSIKHHLRRILDQTHMTYEEMSTLLIQIEAILNSRPISPISDDPNDLYPLTPAHFLIGRSIHAVPHPQIASTTITSLQRWKRIELLKQQFWHRFSNEYVLWLQQKTKWHTSSGALTEGALVIVKDRTLPPLLWQLGRVVRILPGGDGVARVADIKTKKGIIRRAFNNICLLPEATTVEDHRTSRPAACSE